MRRRFISLTMAFVIAFVFVPAIAADDGVITFPDVNFEAAVREVTGKPEGPVTRGDVAGITELSVRQYGAPEIGNYNGNIVSLAGIEYFTALEILDCGKNQLTELDIGGNTALTVLKCDDNRIRSLALSGNPELTVLNCAGNRLRSLNVSENPELTELICVGNGLTALDVNRNSKLTQLSCNSNRLLTLDVSAQPSLDILSCDYNRLTKLDVGRNPVLKQLSCGTNQLRKLDIKGNPALVTLHCDQNLLTELDISANPALLEVRCHDNYLKTVDASNNPVLQWLYYDPQNAGPPPPNPLDSASPWALDGIASAIGKDIVPDNLQGSYQNVIIRAEFCRMAVRYVEYATGLYIGEVLEENGLSRDPSAFSDITNTDILAAYALGITGGMVAPTADKPGLFDPNSQFTREQAATMIRNTCRALGIDADNPPPSGFADIDAASSWAVDAINFCRANGVMAGTDDNNFNPKAIYTREESIVTFDNMG